MKRKKGNALPEVYLEPGYASMMELFWENRH